MEYTTPSSRRPAVRPESARRDARLNRERLLRSGREVFASQGFEATLNDVAKHAGLGVGTAYRNFANKEELIDAIVVQQVGEVEEVLHKALSISDAWRGLVYYMEHGLALQIQDRGMAQLFTSLHAGSDRYDWSRDRIAPLVNRVAKHAREQHAIRGEITGTDLILIQIGIVGIAQSLHEGGTLPQAPSVSAAEARPASGRTDHSDIADGLDLAGEDADSHNSAEAHARSRFYRRYLWIALNGIRATAVTTPSNRTHPVKELPVHALHTAELHRTLAQ